MCGFSVSTHRCKTATHARHLSRKHTCTHTRITHKQPGTTLSCHQWSTNNNPRSTHNTAPCAHQYSPVELRVGRQLLAVRGGQLLRGHGDRLVEAHIAHRIGELHCRRRREHHIVGWDTYTWSTHTAINTTRTLTRTQMWWRRRRRRALNMDYTANICVQIRTAQRDNSGQFSSWTNCGTGCVWRWREARRHTNGMREQTDSDHTNTMTTATAGNFGEKL